MEKNYRSEIFCRKVYKRLNVRYGIPEPPLKYKNTEQLAIAVILSAQCTDERVNQVTPVLFQKYPEIKDLAGAPVGEIEKIIFSTGFYHNKARNISALAGILVNKYNGKIPSDFEILIQLPGIGRKTANVIMAVAFNQTPGIVVDTHVRRITGLLGMTDEKTPEKIEKDLMTFLPEDLWLHFSLYLIFLGRDICIARRPRCNDCFLKNICMTGKNVK